MISAMGKRLAGTFGLAVNAQNGVLFGSIGGYQASVIENTSQRKYYIVFPARPSEGAPMQAPGDFLEAFARGRKGIAGVMAEQYALHIAVQMRSYKKTVESFHEIFQAVTDYLKVNRFVSCCMQCGETAENGLYVLWDNCQFLCEGCAVNAEARLQEMAAQQAKVRSNLPMGLLGAFLGSLIGVAAWVLVYQLGYIAGLVGLLLLICALKGYEKLGGCADLKGVIATVILSVVMVFASLYLCYGIEVYKVFHADGYNFLECLLAVPAALSANKLIGAFIGDLALGYLFMGAAGFGVIVNACRKARPNASVTRIG